ncbi:diacylglycerol kinase family protein [Thalassobacillus hwangdonensis]|uniref:Diacylglycerol kinase family protein n=1 Tax=Thalassobacillus hwangdonensis TaxID=546108 RepID=A0ABW3KY23_9BACI
MSSDLKGNNSNKGWIGFRVACAGIILVIRNERNFRIHLVAGAIVIIAGLLLRVSLLEWTVLLLTIAMVLSLEMINTSIERVMNHLSPEFHPAVGAVKDVAAGAVLVAAIFSIIIGMIIFLPKLTSILF